MTKNEEWLTPNAFSKEVGVSPQAVLNAIETGRFEDDTLRTEKTKAGKARYKIHLERGKTQWVQNRGGRQPVTDKEYQQARRREQMAKADIEEMKAQELAGELIRADEVRKHFTKIAIVMREGVLGQAVKVAPSLVDMTDVSDIENTMRAALTEILEDMSNAGRSGALFK